MTALNRVEIGIDCADPAGLASFWARALDGTVVDVDGAPEVHDAPGGTPHIWFQPVPEGKVAKNRLHLDLLFDTAADAAGRRAELLSVGGTVLAEHANFLVLADPEGNEFCLCWP
jgi:Glyoxalase-like domain